MPTLFLLKAKCRSIFWVKSWQRLEKLIEEEKQVEVQLSAKLQEKQTELANARQVQGSARTEFETKTKHIQELQKQLFDVDKDIAVTANHVSTLKSENQRSNEEIRTHKERTQPFGSGFGCLVF